jgi:hypothetical protein
MTPDSHTAMTPGARIRHGLLGLPTDRIPLHCRSRMAPLTLDYQWIRDLGWGVVGSHPTVECHADGCTIRQIQVTEKGLPCVRRIIETPAGTLTDLDTTNAAGGRARLEYLFKDERDYPALLAWITSFRYAPAYESFHRVAGQLGDAGYAYAWCGYDPMHELMINAMGVEAFSFEWMDRPERVRELYAALLEKHRAMFRLVADGPAEFVTYGGNIQPTVVGRDRFATDYLPVFHEFGDLLHARGKRLGAHVDDATRLLADLMARCPWDVMEAFAVAPDGDMTLAEAGAAWPGRVISLNFPSKLHHAGEADIRMMARQYVAEAPQTGGLLISLTEDFPPECARKLFTIIAEVVREKS